MGQRRTLQTGLSCEEVILDLGWALSSMTGVPIKRAEDAATARDTVATRVGRGLKLPRSPWRDCGPADPDPRPLASTESQPAGAALGSERGREGLARLGGRPGFSREPTRSQGRPRCPCEPA